MAQEKHFDVDAAEEYDDGTRAVTYEGDTLRSDSEDDATATLTSSRKQRLQAGSFKKTKQGKEKASMLRVKNWDAGLMESAEYAGKVVKRKDIVSEDEGMASPDEDAMAEWSDAEPFGESDEEDKEAAVDEGDDDDEEASDMGSNDDESDEDEGEQDAEKIIRGFQKEDSAQLMGSKDSAKLVEKANHVRNQKLIWERCLEIQIYTKRLMTTSKTASTAEEDADEDKKTELIKQLYSCIDVVSELQEKLCNSDELSGEPRFEDDSKKRKRSVDDAWSQITQANEAVLPQYNEILNTYSRKTNLAGGSQAKKFKAVNQDILAQVESVLADPQRVKRKAHAPVESTTEAGENGHTTAEEDDSSDQLDELMYDDSDFYQQLLKEFIESGGGSQDALTRRTHRKKKKVVNRKASKGRVLRYTVHPKLENFMFPEPYPASGMDVDELFRSIFGQSRQA